MKNHSKLIIGFVLVFLVVVFSVINTETVNVNFAFVKVQSPLIYIILGSAFIGAIIVLFTWYSTFWKQRREVKSLRKQVEDFETVMADKVEKEVAIEKAAMLKQVEEKQEKIDELEQQFKELSGELFLEDNEDMGHEDHSE